MRLLALILAACAFALPLRANDGGGDGGVVVLPETVNAAIVGDRLLLVHDNGTLTYMELAVGRIVDPTLNAWGFPGMGYANDTGASNPHVLTFTYDSALGSHTITTPCRGMSNARCVQRHAAMIAEMQRAFPRLPT